MVCKRLFLVVNFIYFFFLIAVGVEGGLCLKIMNAYLDRIEFPIERKVILLETKKYGEEKCRCINSFRSQIQPKPRLLRSASFPQF